ncbi:MAG: LysM peptidoglycan-binding domain-containing protein [Sandaracinaceae bacterium]|nr:LysM peptidoglycan-binding domain-containing protein [Sandaracinaceae bacterium]
MIKWKGVWVGGLCLWMFTLSKAQADEWSEYGEESVGTIGLRRRRMEEIPPTHVVKRGDTLWSISGRYYGNPWEWPRLWSYNPEITNPHWIYPDDVIRLRPEGEGQAVSAEQRTRPRLRLAERGPDFISLRRYGYLDRMALEQSGEIVGSPEDHMLLATEDKVYIRFLGERSEKERPLTEWTIYRLEDASRRNPPQSGTVVRILGTVRLESYDQEERLAVGRIIEALDPIERGDLVAVMDRRFELVRPTASDRNLESHVVAAFSPQELSAQAQIVFVPVGEEDGVRLGNRFFVVRYGDNWRKSAHSLAIQMANPLPSSPSRWPKEVIAEGRVVSLRPKSAGIWITQSIAPVEVGDQVEMREGY